MNKVYFLFLFSLFTFFSQAQALKNNFVIGAQLPFLYNNDREKPDNDSSSSTSLSFRPRINIYVQADRYDAEKYGRLSKFSTRVDSCKLNKMMITIVIIIFIKYLFSIF